MKEIRFLQWRNQKVQTLDFVDIEPSQNAGVSLEDAMAVMHVIGADGKVSLIVLLLVSEIPYIREYQLCLKTNFKLVTR